MRGSKNHRLDHHVHDMELCASRETQQEEEETLTVLRSFSRRIFSCVCRREKNKSDLWPQQECRAAVKTHVWSYTAATAHAQ